MSNLIASARGPAQEIMGFNTSLLTSEESACLRPAVDDFIARSWKRSLCLRKAHDAYTHLPDGRPLMGQGPDYKAIYVLRDPWDVAVSAANHWDVSIDKAVKSLCSSKKPAHVDSDITEQFPQHLLSWSRHALSWLNSPMEICLIQYENMHSEPLLTFRKAIRFLGLDHDDEHIKDAIHASEFKRLQRLEVDDGYVETPRKGTRFFRKGVKGEGLECLSSAQLEQLRQQRAIVDKAIGEKAGKV